MTDPDDRVETFLHSLDQWEQAYPLSAFPEPDLKMAAELLKAGGMTLDAVSASNMRHVVKCIAPEARAAIAALSPDDAVTETWQPIETAMHNSRAVLVHCAERHNTYTATLLHGEWEHFGGRGKLEEAPTHWRPLPAPPAMRSAALPRKETS